ncbi:MAG: response regulator transcription factor [Armatimonas sp.]
MGIETPYRLFLTEDHPLLGKELRTFLERQADIVVVGEADSGELAFREIGRLLPDLVLMDISLKDSGGIETTRRITHAWPQVRVLAFTLHADQGYLQKMLQAGASGYVSKSSRVDTLLAAIRATVNGQAYIDPALAAELLEPPPPPVLAPLSSGKALSPREESVGKQVARGFSNREIADRLEIRIESVERARARLMRKLALTSRVDLIHYALAHGWLLESLA